VVVEIVVMVMVMMMAMAHPQTEEMNVTKIVVIDPDAGLYSSYLRR
jgi:hypothetical protein